MPNECCGYVQSRVPSNDSLRVGRKSASVPEPPHVLTNDSDECSSIENEDTVVENDGQQRYLKHSPNDYFNLNERHYRQTAIPIPPYTPPPLLSFSSSFLKPDAQFTGFQESGRQQYQVNVKLAEVDLHTSTISGFLTIHDLTETCSEITTFFMGEIIGPNFSFETKHDSWGTNLKTDVQHWARFPSWRALNIDLRNDSRNSQYYNDGAFEQETIFMRWKEMFLCPDAHVKHIRGASFAGFYYMAFNQITGNFTGLYYHQFTDRFQQLNLSFVQDGGIKQIYQYM